MIAASPADVWHATVAAGPADVWHATVAAGPADVWHATVAAGPADVWHTTVAAGPADVWHATVAAGPAAVSKALENNAVQYSSTYCGAIFSHLSQRIPLSSNLTTSLHYHTDFSWARVDHCFPHRLIK